MVQQGWTVVMTNGGLRSLVALASALSATPRPRVVLIHVHPPVENAATRLRYVQNQAEHFSVRQVVHLDVPHILKQQQRKAAALGTRPAAPPLMQSRLLLAALSHAMELTADRLIWPVQANGDFARTAAAVELLVLVRHLASLECAAESTQDADTALPAIDTPLLELTDRQIVELGNQLQVPWHLAWSCDLHGDHPCRVCDACRRRQAAFELAGIIDPTEEFSTVR